MQLSANCWNYLRLLIDFRFADFRMIRISAFPVFPISGFQHFRFTCQPAFDFAEPVEYIEGLFEVVALNSQFSDPKRDLPS